jgi:hypothetical protein
MIRLAYTKRLQFNQRHFADGAFPLIAFFKKPLFYLYGIGLARPASALHASTARIIQKSHKLGIQFVAF